MITDQNEHPGLGFHQRPDLPWTSKNPLVSRDDHPTLLGHLRNPHFIGGVGLEVKVVPLDGKARALKGIWQNAAPKIPINEEDPAQAAFS